MQKAALPNFFVVGAGKAGTTSLYHYLRQHPRIYMSPIKEPCYFASEIRVENYDATLYRQIPGLSPQLPQLTNDGRRSGWLVSELEDYRKLFKDVEAETAIGEASAAYLWSQTAAGNIASCIPDARIIMILRDPSERAFSQYLHQLAVGLIRSTFREHLERCMRNDEGKLGVYYPLLEVGLYHRQVKRYLDRFPQNNIRIYWYEEAWGRPDRLLADLFQFLAVDSTFCPDTSRKSLEQKAPRFPTINYAAKRFHITHWLNEAIPSRLRPPIIKFLFRKGRALTMDAKDRRYLIDYYREDVTNLASLLNRDLSAWLS